MFSRVWLFVYPWTSPPGSSVHEEDKQEVPVFLSPSKKTGTGSYSRGSSWPRDQTQVSCISCTSRWILYHCATWEALHTTLSSTKRLRSDFQGCYTTKLWTLFNKFMNLFFVHVQISSPKPFEDIFQNSELFRFYIVDIEQNFVIKHSNIYAGKSMNIHIAYKTWVWVSFCGQVNSGQVKSGITDKGLQWNFCLHVFLNTDIVMRNCEPLSVLGSVSSVTQSCPTLCDPMNRSMPGLPVHHQLPEFTPSHPSSQWCHPAISSSGIPFSSCPQSFPASESFPMSQLFAWGGQSTGVSASASVPPKKSQGWSPSEWTSWISLPSKGLSRVFSNTTLQKHQFFGAQPSSQSNSHIHTWPQEKP